MAALERVDILHFSDVLCIWAYVAQIRMDELRDQLGDKVAINYHFIPVYGDVAGKLSAGWAHRGGNEGYAEHVREVAGRFEHVKLHPDVWLKNVPTTSSHAHQLLKGVQLLEQRGDLEADAAGRMPSEVLAWNLRLAFFAELVDVSGRRQLLELAERSAVPMGPLEEMLDSGAALASLESDVQLRSVHQVSGSPTLVFNEGRQKLYGNVGYRVIEANVLELLNHSDDRASWC